jgi:hypothetical protein
VDEGERMIKKIRWCWSLLLIGWCFGSNLGAQGVLDQEKPLLIKYLGAVIGRVIIYDVSYKKPNQGKKFPERLKIECQNIETSNGNAEIMFGRTDLDEPVYLNVMKNEIIDYSAGGSIIKANCKVGDSWENYRKDRDRVISQVEVTGWGETRIIRKKKYIDCISMIIRDLRTHTIEKRTYAYGIGLIEEIDYEDMKLERPRVIRTIRSYSDK